MNDGFRRAMTRLAVRGGRDGAGSCSRRCPRRQAQSSTSTVVISQVYGGGGNAGATYQQRFHRAVQPRHERRWPITGWSVQYTSASRHRVDARDRPSGIAAARPVLPDPGGRRRRRDAAAAHAGRQRHDPMSGTAGKVALVISQISRSPAAATCAQPPPAIQDFVGYGAANNFEGAGPAPGLTNTTAALRDDGGCTDTDNNADDFAVRRAHAAQHGASSTRTASLRRRRSARRNTTIAAVQGSGQASPIAGTVVSVAGLVTGRIIVGSARGFFMQMPPTARDANPATSDGIFVFTGAAPPAERRGRQRRERDRHGRRVRPAADPRSPPLTEISCAPTVIAALDTATPLPAPITLTAAEPSRPGRSSSSSASRACACTSASLTVVAPDRRQRQRAQRDGDVSNGVFYGVDQRRRAAVPRAGHRTAPTRCPAARRQRAALRQQPRAPPRRQRRPGRRAAARRAVGRARHRSRRAARLRRSAPTRCCRIAGAAPGRRQATRAPRPVPAPTARRVHGRVVQLERFFDTVNDPDRRRGADTGALDNRLQEGVAGDPQRAAIAGHRRRRGGREPGDAAGARGRDQRRRRRRRRSPIRDYVAYLVEGNDSAASTSASWSRPRASTCVEVGAGRQGRDLRQSAARRAGDAAQRSSAAACCGARCIPPDGAPFPITVIVNHCGR